MMLSVSFCNKLFEIIGNVCAEMLISFLVPRDHQKKKPTS